MEPEVETRVAVRSVGSPDDPAAGLGSHADEKTIFSISPTLLFVKLGYAAAAIGALLLVSVCAVELTWVSAWASVLLGLCLFLIPGYFHLMRRLVRYSLTESKLEIDQGLVARTTRNIPIGRIQDVTVTTTMTQRLLGFGDLVIDNSSQQGGKIILRNINSPRQYADILLRQMRSLER